MLIVYIQRMVLSAHRILSAATSVIVQSSPLFSLSCASHVCLDLIQIDLSRCSNLSRNIIKHVPCFIQPMAIIESIRHYRLVVLKVVNRLLNEVLDLSGIGACVPDFVIDACELPNPYRLLVLG